jgi:hypothetical protein
LNRRTILEGEHLMEPLDDTTDLSSLSDQLSSIGEGVLDIANSVDALLSLLP